MDNNQEYPTYSELSLSEKILFWGLQAIMFGVLIFISSFSLWSN